MAQVKILCVDDETYNRDLLRAVLTPRGYEVLEAADGQQALEILGQNRPDLILLDVMMPGMDGYAVCRAIKADPGLLNIPVVMITALTAKTERIKSIEAGAEDFISKPFDQAEVLARIAMLLRVKTLGDQLRAAYTNIGQITSFGRSVARTFSTTRFEFSRALAKVVEKVLGRNADPDRPSLVLTGLRLKAGWRWYAYERDGEKVRRSVLKTRLELALDLPAGHAARIVSFAGKELENREIKALVAKLRESLIRVLNLLCFLSEDVCLMCLNYQRPITRYDADVINTLVTQTVFLKAIFQQMDEIAEAFDYSLLALARASEANDEDTGNHIHRVGEYCALMARELGASDAFVRSIRVQALTHDVGKIHIPAGILLKPGALSPEEMAIMRRHPEYGANILGDHPRLAMARNIALSHHERWDGTGYPQGLRGKAIPLEARILNLADQYDALRNARVYKPAFDHAKARDIIVKGDGRTRPEHFDPAVLAAFQKTADRFEKTYECLKDTPREKNAICSAK